MWPCRLCAEPLSRGDSSGARQTRRLVACCDRPAEARAGRGDAPPRSSRRCRRRSSRGDAAAALRDARTRSTTCRFQARRVPGRHRRLRAAARLRVAALGAARDDGPRAADRVRQPREPDARARDGARARDRGPAGDRRVAMAPRAAAARREPAHRVHRRGGWRCARAVAQPVSRRVSGDRAAISPSSTLSLDWRVFAFTLALAVATCVRLRPDARASRHGDVARRGDEGGQPRHRATAASGSACGARWWSRRSRCRSCSSSARCCSCAACAI